MISPARSLACLAVLLLAASTVQAASQCGIDGLDFSSMTEDLTGTDGSQTYEYFVHVCGALTEQTCATGVPDAATCQLTQQGIPYVNGVWPTVEPTWQYVNGRDISEGVFYTLSGQYNCAEVRTANIIFQCGPKLITPVPVTADGCNQNYTITTPLACGSGPSPSTCAYGGLDFSSLQSGPDLPGTDGTQTYDYFVHVCDTLTESACVNGVPSASTCQLTRQDIPYVNGEWTGPSSAAWGFVNGVDVSEGVYYQLSGQNNCAEVRAAFVIFQCGPKLITPITVTLGTTGADQCTQNFTITTPLACPSAPPTSACSFDGLDFSSLTTQDILGSDGTPNYSYALRLCGVVQSNSACTSESSSACQIPNNGGGSGTAYDIGTYSAQDSSWSYLNPGSPAEGVLLQMTGQDNCFGSGGADVYKTYVQLECAQKQGELSIITQAGSCSQNWTLPTPLACPATIAKLEAPKIALE